MESIKAVAGRTVLALSLVSILILAGCGGGGGTSAAAGSGSGTGGSGSGTGGSGTGGSGTGGSGGTLSGASITVNWPARSRDALTSPASALSMEVVFKAASPGGLDVKVDADRDPTKAGAYVGTYPLPSSIVKSAVQMTVNFYAQAARQGSVVGTAAATVQAGSSLSLGTVDVTDLVKSVSVIGTVAVNPKAGPTQLNFQAIDTKKNILALTPGSATWSVVGGTAATITSDGVLTPIAKGSVTVKVIVDGMSTTQVVNVSQYAGNPFRAIPIPMPPNVVYADRGYLNNNGDVAAIGLDHYPDSTTSVTRDFFYWSYTDAGGPVTMSTAVGGYGKITTDLDGMDDAGDVFGTTYGNGGNTDGNKTVVMQVGVPGVHGIFAQLDIATISHNKILAVSPDGHIVGGSDTPGGVNSGVYYFFGANSRFAVPHAAPDPSIQNAATYDHAYSINNSGQIAADGGYMSSYSSQPVALTQPSILGTFIGYGNAKINSNGKIVTTVTYYPLPPNTGTATAVFLYNSPFDTNPKQLRPPPGYQNMFDFGFNDNGLVLGTIETNDGTATQKWFIADSTGVYPFVPDIPSDLPAQYGVAPLAMNNSGLILGKAMDQEVTLFLAKLK